MSSFNDNLKKITIIELLFVILALYGILLLFDLIGYPINNDWLYVGIILYFIYRLRFFTEEFKKDVADIFTDVSFRALLVIVVVNVFFSYGMLYLSIFGLDLVNNIHFNSIYGFLGVASTVIISPVCEELLFRGVFLNRLKLIIPTSFAIIISSLLFGALHGYGNIISAFVFGICMSIIYLKSDNILLCILAHFMNNLVAEIIYFIDFSGLIFTNVYLIFIISVLAIISFYLIMISIKQEWKYVT